MAKKFYTILVVPDATSKFRRFNIPTYFLKAIVISLIFFISTSVYFTFDYMNKRKMIVELKSLREENRRKEVEIQNFAKAIESLKRDMSFLQKSNTKLRIIAGVERPENNKYVFGLGGENIDYFQDVSRRSQEKLLKQIHKDLEQLKVETHHQGNSLEELSDIMSDQKSILACTPSIWPTKGWLTSAFGYRRSPFTGKRELHKGIDVATKEGTQIIAPADGIVTYSGTKGGLGNVLIIEHGYNFSTKFGHNSMNKVKVGDRVKRGDVIAYIGNTGRSTGPHLHYEVRVNGVAVNPLDYILD